MQLVILEEFKSHIIISQKSMDSLSRDVEHAAKICIESLKINGKIILFGNGGSAADANHLVAEHVWRFENNKRKAQGLKLNWCPW